MRLVLPMLLAFLIGFAVPVATNQWLWTDAARTACAAAFTPGAIVP